MSDRMTRLLAEGAELAAEAEPIRRRLQALDEAIAALDQAQRTRRSISPARIVSMEGWTIDHSFIERGVSGSVPLGERPEGGKLLAALQAGDIVIAAKLDRMFRSALDALTVIKDFQAPRRVAVAARCWRRCVRQRHCQADADDHLGLCRVRAGPDQRAHSRRQAPDAD
jgi:hypothetical protein